MAKAFVWTLVIALFFWLFFEIFRPVDQDEDGDRT